MGRRRGSVAVLGNGSGRGLPGRYTTPDRRAQRPSLRSGLSAGGHFSRWMGECGQRPSRSGARSNRTDRLAAALTPVDDPLDVICCPIRVLVLPNADDQPASLGQGSIGVAVPYNICLKLASPPDPVGAWRRRMLRTAMPEATVHKDRDTLACKCDVDCAPRTPWYRQSDSVPPSSPVQNPPEHHLRRGVSARLATHPQRDGRRAGDRSGRLRHGHRAATSGHARADVWSRHLPLRGDKWAIARLSCRLVGDGLPDERNCNA